MLVRVPRDENVMSFRSFWDGGTTFSATYSGSQSDAGGFSCMKIASLCDLCKAVTASLRSPVTALVFFNEDFRPVGGVPGVTSFVGADAPLITAGVSLVTGKGAGAFTMEVSLITGVGAGLAAGTVTVCSFFPVDAPQPMVLSLRRAEVTSVPSARRIVRQCN